MLKFPPKMPKILQGSLKNPEHLSKIHFKILKFPPNMPKINPNHSVDKSHYRFIDFNYKFDGKNDSIHRPSWVSFVVCLELPWPHDGRPVRAVRAGLHGRRHRRITQRLPGKRSSIGLRLRSSRFSLLFRKHLFLQSKINNWKLKNI